MELDDQHTIETYKSLMLYASTGLKFILTANGVGAIAIMTFLGHFVASGKDNPPDLRFPLGVFLLGVLIGGFATVTSYMCQLRIFNGSVCKGSVSPSHAPWWRWSICLIISGMVTFGVASLWAVSKLK